MSEQNEQDDIYTPTQVYYSLGNSYFEMFKNIKDAQLLGKQIKDWRKRFQQLNSRGLVFVTFCDFPGKLITNPSFLDPQRSATMSSNFLSCPSSRSLSRLSSAGNYPRLSRVTTPAMFFNRLKKTQDSVDLYRMEPLRPFKPKEVLQVVKDVLESLFEDKKQYQEDLFRKLAKIASNTIKEKVKLLNYSRCRIVSFVYTGQNQGQGTAIASMTLIDKEHDGFVDYTINRKGYFATAVVYGIYKL